MSKDPPKDLEQPGTRQSSAAKEISRKVREVRKEMKGGNGVREANVVTLCSKWENRIA